MHNKERLKLIIQNWFVEKTSIRIDDDKLYVLVDRIIGDKERLIKEVSVYISVGYLMKLHPELSTEDAISLEQFAISKTIRYKECYGDGSIIYPKWKSIHTVSKVD